MISKQIILVEFQMRPTVLFQAIQFICFKSVELSNSSIWPIDRIISSATTLCQSRPGTNSNEGVLHIPQTSKAGL